MQDSIHRIPPVRAIATVLMLALAVASLLFACQPEDVPTSTDSPRHPRCTSLGQPSPISDCALDSQSHAHGRADTHHSHSHPATHFLGNAHTYPNTRPHRRPHANTNTYPHTYAHTHTNCNTPSTSTLR